MILVVPKNTLSSSQMGKLLKKGYVVIECDEPDKVRVISPEPTNINSDDYFMSALHAIKTTLPTNPSEKFVANLCKRLDDKKVISNEQEDERSVATKMPNDGNDGNKKIIPDEPNP